MTDSPTRVNHHIWGTSRYLYVGKQEALPIVFGKAGGESSLHWHRHKSNCFIVCSGIVDIDRIEHGAPISTVRLTAGGTLSVPAGIKHRMRFITDAELYEFYRALPGQQIDLADIVRVEPGKPPGFRP